MSDRPRLLVRTASPADAPGLAGLFATAGLCVAAPALVARLESLRAGTATALLAEEWGPPSGLVVVGWQPTLLAERPVARITTLLVDPDARRRGVGRALLRAASQAARSAGCGDMEIGVPEAQPSLAAFCRATGFDPAGTGFVRPLRKRGSGIG